MHAGGLVGGVAEMDGGVHRRLVRPRRRVVALGLLLLVLGLCNLGRGWQALRYASLLPGVPMTVTWPYLAATGCFWGAALTVCAVALFRCYPWARWAALAVTTLYQAYGWFDRLSFDASDYAIQTRPRDLLLTILLLAYVWVVLNLPSVRKEFGR